MWKYELFGKRRYKKTNGYCDPQLHYMVDLTERLEQIKAMVDAEMYFAINRARQYGKTTVLTALADYLQEDYTVISLDFQGMSYADFASEQSFAAAFSRQLLMETVNIPGEVKEVLENYAAGTASQATLSVLFMPLIKMCRLSRKKIVLIIDEVDSATNNQVFIDFLAQIRLCYLKRKRIPTFQSVILAGVYDIRNIKQKIRPDAEHKTNSPWNIAAKFDVNMDFSPKEIAGMLREYEAEHQTGMKIEEMSQLIYDYTSGYPYLVSGLCKNMDEEIAGTESFPDKSSAWTRAGFEEAVKLLVGDNNPLFQPLTGKLSDDPMLRTVLYELLFTGKTIPYVAQNRYIDMASMLGFIKNDRGSAVVSNRIFETVLYNLFISEEFSTSGMYDAGVQERNRFIVGGHLDMKRVLEKFVETFD